MRPVLVNRKSEAVTRTRDLTWLRMDELPIGKALTMKLIKAGLIVSHLACEPGSKRGVRLIEAQSFHKWLRSQPTIIKD